MTMYNIYNRQPAKDWVSLAADVRQLREYGAKNASIMTELEGRDFRQKLHDTISGNYATVARGALGLFESSLRVVVDARKKLNDARSREVSGWDGVKLSGELAAVNFRVEQALQPGNPFSGKPGSAERLKTIYNEYRQGSSYQQRAVAEIFSELSVKTRNLERSEHLLVVGLAERAKMDLSQLRSSQDIISAEQAERQAVSTMLETRQLVKDVGTLMDGRSPTDIFSVSDCAAAMRRVRLTDSGEIEILDASHPDVTGFDNSKLLEELKK